MIIVMEHGASQTHIEQVINAVRELGYIPHPIQGTERTVIAAVGDERGKYQLQKLENYPEVESVVPILKPFKLVSREVKQEKSVFEIGPVAVGGEEFIVMAGPCAVENMDLTLETAKKVKAAGAHFLRGGAFKPRTSPYSFRGLGKSGLEILKACKEETGLGIITEAMDVANLDLVAEYTDIIQIGARNMQNFQLLTAVGQLRKPVMLKRGMSSTINEWLQSAEYITSEGNYHVILCERGIRTFETETRNTLDLSAVPVLNRISHLPVMIDPSHGTGHWDLVEPMALAGIAAGADGLIIEVHPDPISATSDGGQSLRPDRFEALMHKARVLAQAMGRKMTPLAGVTVNQ